MEPLARLQAHIGNLKDLREVIGALRGLAATHVQEGQAALPGIRSYVATVEDAIAEAAALGPASGREQVDPNGPGKGALLLISSEHGFVGGFNERLLERASDALSPDKALFVVGTRGATLASERGLEVQQSFEMATRVAGVLAMSRQVATALSGFEAAEVIFARYRLGGGFDVSQQTILPLDPSLMSGSRLRSPPLHHLDRLLLLRRLAEEYLLAEITRCMVENMTSENGARLRATETADRNIEDRLRQLKTNEQALRQASVTDELLELVTAAESLQSPE
ncbi:MAG: F0F1 ATP synthase subunit gamma [Limibacillus sp.]|jgi:F-type H+-transporting ATPase subunit gamma